MPSLVQIMACRLFGDNPLSEPIMVYCQLKPKEHISMKFYLKFKGFHSRKCIWRCCLQNGGHLVSAPMCSVSFIAVWSCLVLVKWKAITGSMHHPTANRHPLVLGWTPDWQCVIAGAQGDSIYGKTSGWQMGWSGCLVVTWGLLCAMHSWWIYQSKYKEVLLSVKLMLVWSCMNTSWKATLVFLI